jgi:exodeoxyribonuclease V alpha subunit
VLPQLDGDGYEAWVGGVDPETGELRGRVRNDEHALRFAEVVVNGPKSWSIAAELHPDIAAAYAGAQTRAAEEIVAYFAQTATTRVGPRGGQVSTPVTRLEAVAVQHHTSRAGDPHRHIHLQINARVQAAGKWRGIDSVAVRNSITAVHGIGHATVMTDPQFRAALAQHGFSLDAESGEVVELAGYVPAFSKRAEQIAGQVAGYEAAWRGENPGQQPGPALRRSWDARAWVEHRPDKTPAGGVPDGQVVHERWLDELDRLGYRPPARPVEVVGQSIGGLDRDAAAAEILARLTAAGSAWNQADIRGEAEQLIARRDIIAAPEVRAELAEDLVARAAGIARPLPGLEDRVASMPVHIRTFTSSEAIAVEAELADRLAGRAAADAVTGRDATPEQVTAAAAAAGVRLDAAQAEAAAALAGSHALVLVTGAAGAGKTTTLATTRAALDTQGRRLMVVTPTLKAAKGARVETGAQTGTVAWLIHQHGWRHDEAGRWTRLSPGDADTGRFARAGSIYPGPRVEAQLSAGDLVVVDEAGMLDQDTTRALLAVVDDAGARVALVGDAHQLPAIGRGGVLELAGRWAQRTATLDVIHRFTHDIQIAGITETVEDTAYAELSLRMREGAAGDPGAVFDQLAERGQVHVHPSEDARREAVATAAAAAVRAGRPAAVSVATNDAAAVLNAAIRDQLVATGHINDGSNGDTVATTGAGQRIGVGDLVVTRDNDRDLDVANRDTWTVTAVAVDGSITVTPTGTPPTLGGSAGGRILPAGYVNRHVQLGYAGTIHSVQGQTAHTGMLVLDEHTSVQAAYVGMTRGRRGNDLHVVAADLEDGRGQWIDTAGRGRADLGLEAARAAAEREAAPYAGVAPSTGPQVNAAELDRLTASAPVAPVVRVDSRLVERLRAAWREQEITAVQLERREPQLATAQAVYERAQRAAVEIAPYRLAAEQAQARAEAAAGPAVIGQQLLDQRSRQVELELFANWNQDRPVAGDAARLVAEGPGRFGRITGGRAAVEEAEQFLRDWVQKWRPVVDQLRDVDTATDYAGRHPGNDDFVVKVRDYATDRAAQELPHAARDVARGKSTTAAAEQAQDAYQQRIERQHRQAGERQAFDFWSRRRPRGQDLPELAQDVTELSADVADLRERHDRAAATVDEIAHSPAVQAQPDPAGWLTTTQHTWRQDRETARQAAATRAAIADAQAARDRMHSHEHDQPYHYGPDHGHDGPSFGR